MMNKYISKFLLLTTAQFSVIALAVAGVYFWGYFDSGETIDQQIAAINTSISEETRKKKETEELLLEEENITKKANRLAEEIKDFNKKIPNQLRHSDMINYLRALCKDLNCTVSKNEPTLDAKDRLTYFEKMKLSVKIEARFPVLERLIFLLVTGEKLFLVENLNLRRVDSQKTDSLVELTGLLIAYKQLSQNEEQKQ